MAYFFLLVLVCYLLDVNDHSSYSSYCIDHGYYNGYYYGQNLNCDSPVNFHDDYLLKLKNPANYYLTGCLYLIDYYYLMNDSPHLKNCSAWTVVVNYDSEYYFDYFLS